MNIDIHNLQIAYNNKVIIPCANLKIPESKITILIGPNGCGKSTLLKSIMKIIPIKKGEILLNGTNIKTLPQKKLAKQIALLPQTPTIPSGINVKNLVAYGRFPHQKLMSNLTKQDYEIIDWAIEETKISDLKYRSVEKLSGGQRQRVWIALALAQKTDILILDEPTTYLDMAHQLEILELLQKLNKENKMTILMVLHELNHSSKFADNIIGMKKGNIIFEGKPNDVINTENLKKLYEIEATLIENKEKGYPICIDYSTIN